MEKPWPPKFERGCALGFRRSPARPVVRPCSGFFSWGTIPGPEIYVRNKIKNSADLGMASDLQRLPETASLEETLAIVRAFNGSDTHDGILVQSPLPDRMGAEAEQRVFDTIDATKDVDGFNPVNVGRLIQKRPALAPCTPSGIIELLDRGGVEIGGARAVVIGRSDIVGKPMAMLLLHRNRDGHDLPLENRRSASRRRVG